MKTVTRIIAICVLLISILSFSGYIYVSAPDSTTLIESEETPATEMPELLAETGYQVKRGDTLCKIAKAFYGDVTKYKLISDYNGLANPNIILIGQTLIIPNIELAPENVMVRFPEGKDMMPVPLTDTPATVEVTPEEYSQYSQATAIDTTPAFKYIDCGLSHDLQDFTYNLCEEYGLPFELAMAVMKNESGFRIDVVSGTGDYGLMQINSTNHKWLRNTLGISDFLDAEDNITAGVYMINYLWQRYPDAHKCMMAYNMGEGGAMTQWKQGIYTSHYSRLVVGTMDEYLAR